MEPPDSANWLSLIFSLLTLPLGAVLILRMNFHERLRPYRVLFLALILTGVVTNRTFLAWTSSGLETAAFNFFLTLWVCCALCLKPFTGAWLAGISSAAALAYLTRPDGLLPALVTVSLAGLAIYGAGRRSQASSAGRAVWRGRARRAWP